MGNKNSRKKKKSSSSSTIKKSINYIKQQKIGEGKYGRVFRGLRETDQSEVAMKYLDFSKLPEGKIKTQVERTLSELDAMKRLGKDDNIVELFDTRLENTSIIIVMEFCPNGNFRDILRKEAPIGDINKIHQYLFDIVSGLRALRVASIVHRDLKPENILLAKNGKLKLCDFGMARQLDGYNANRICGTLLYIAPEVIKRKKYSHTIDLWALGIILYEMLVNDHPFLSRDIGIDSFAQPKEIARINLTLIKSKRQSNGETKITFPVLPDEVLNARNLICRLLQEKPENRLQYNKLFKALNIPEIDPNETERSFTIDNNDMDEEKGGNNNNNNSSNNNNNNNNGNNRTSSHAAADKRKERIKRSMTLDRGGKLARVVDTSKMASWGPQCTYLQSMKISDIEQGRPKLITLNADITCQDAIAILHENHISSAPVIDSNGNTNGFVDNADLVTHLLDAMQSKEQNLLRGFIVPSKRIVNYGKSKAFENAPFSVSEESNLLSAMLHMGSGVKRFAVTDKNNEFVTVISQSSINSYLLKKIKQLQSNNGSNNNNNNNNNIDNDDDNNNSNNKSIISKNDMMIQMKENALQKMGASLLQIIAMSIEKLNLIPSDREMIVSESNLNAANAFLRISENNISAIPIVNEKGKMVNVLSTSDIALLAFLDLENGRNKTDLSENSPALEAATKIQVAFDALNRMDMSVSEYIDTVKTHKNRDKNLPKKGKLITATRKTTLLEVMEQMDKYRVHRVFVVDSYLKPIGVISHTDVLNTIITTNPENF